MSKPITDFIYNELKPRLFDYIPAIFPSMEFKRKGNKWISEQHIDGTAGTGFKADRAVIKAGYTSVWDTTRQYHKDIISLFMENHNIDIVEAVNRLCDIVCIDKPTYTPEALEAYRKAEERRTLLEQSAERQQQALFQPEGKEVLDYLHRRGWNDEEIKEAGLGYISVEEAKTIQAQYGVGDYYTLSIPFHSGGNITSFKFRTIKTEEQSEKPKYTNLAGADKKTTLFNLTGRYEQDGTIYVVESELDALHAEIKGLEGVVATGGGGLTENLLKLATGRGIKRITLLFDNDERGKGFTEQSIKLAFKYNITPFIAELPTEYKDIDEYLAKHTIDELREVLNSGFYGGMYLYCDVEKFVKESGGTLYDEGEHRLREQVIDIANSTPNEVDRVRILTTYTNLVKENGKPMFTFEALKAEADKAREFKSTLSKAEETKKAVAEINRQVERGNIDTALKMMSEATANLSKIDYKTKYSDLLSLPTEEDLIRRIRNKQGEIVTKYTLSNGRDTEEFTLPAGAITFICAPTSHGKSTFLQNLALQVADTEEEGVILYFTFEEDGDSVFTQLLNKYMNLDLCSNYGNKRSSNNLRALNHYFKASEYNYKYIRNEQIGVFNERREQFIKDYYTSGKLRIIYNDYDSTELIEAVRYISTNTKIKAVFIDYIQLLSKRGNRLQRTEELKDICKDLKNLAIAENLPIVVVAQLNRDANSPLELHSQRIAEAADLERIANKILCLWNTSFIAQKSKDNQSELNTLQERLGFTLGTGGNIYAKLTKNRGGVVGLEAVFDFNGNTGVITDNTEEEKQEEKRTFKSWIDEEYKPL